MIMPWYLSVARSRHLPLPAGFIEPCRPTLVRAPPAGPGWLHEMKHDGFRILARKQGARVEVWSRRGALFNDRFPRIAEAVGALPVDNALIDGEAVVFLPDGHSDFVALRTRAGGEQASFVAFDLLSLDGDDLRQRPLEERRDALSRLVHGVDGVQFSEALAAEGAVVFAHACKLGLEGIVSKRLGAPYSSGRCRSWLKSKNRRLCGGEGMPRRIGSHSLGEFPPGISTDTGTYLVDPVSLSTQWRKTTRGPGSDGVHFR